MARNAGRTWPAVLVAAFLGGCSATGPAAECRLSGPAVVPVVPRASRAVLDAQINGRPAHLLLDTGAAQSQILPDSARRFGMAISGNGYRAGGVGGPEFVSLQTARRVTLGGMTAGNVQFGVGDIHLSPGTDGLLGRDVLRLYDIDMDLAARRVLLYGFADLCAQPSARMAQPMFAVPMVQAATGRGTGMETAFAVRVSVNGVSLLAMIDSGSHTVLSPGAARRAGISDAALASDPKIRVQGIGAGTPAGVRHVLPSLLLGDLELTNLPVWVVPALPGVDMLLGIDLMAQVHFWISNSSHTLILQYPPQRSPDT